MINTALESKDGFKSIWHYTISAEIGNWLLRSIAYDAWASAKGLEAHMIGESNLTSGPRET